MNLGNHAQPMPAPAQTQADPWSARLSVAWLALAAPLAIVAAVFVLTSRHKAMDQFYLVNGDAEMLVACLLSLVLIALPSVRLNPTRTERLAALVDRRGFEICLATAVIAGMATFAAWWLICQAYPMSMDEFWATFDARIFGRGRFLAEIAPQWRPYAPALQPLWAVYTPGPMETPGHQYWASTYLPVNAALRAAFGHLGSEALAGPFWMAVSIVTVYAVGRDLWPERRDAAFVSAALLATSTQVLVNAMSAFAMPAHLALNLVWLWLFLRKSVMAQAAAIVVGFAACGLHQLIFHPLFAAPFVLQLWLERRWRKAAFYTAAYGMICLFWISYWALMLRAHGIAEAAATGYGAGDFMRRALALLASHNLSAVGVTADNLLRFIAWQNPLAVALAAVAAPAVLAERKGWQGALLAGIVLTIVAMCAVQPFQGEGWGYRYLHGLIGNLCLLGGFGWVRLVGPGSGAVPGRAWAALGVACAFSLAIALPVRAQQVFAFIHPYARAHHAIVESGADVVLLDPSGPWYGHDLVRNDPFLKDGPKVMDLDALAPDQIQALCSRYRVALFDWRDASRYGVPVGAAAEAPKTSRGRALLGLLGCRRHVGEAIGPFAQPAAS